MPPKNSRKKAQEAAAERQKIDLYAILQLPRGATQEEIKRAYKQLALKHHPVRGEHDRCRPMRSCNPHASSQDKNTNNPEAVHEFQQIGLAYRVLSDPEKKR